jgi:hypothetical protein
MTDKTITLIDKLREALDCKIYSHGCCREQRAQAREALAVLESELTARTAKSARGISK